MAANVAHVAAIPGKMVALAVGASAVEPLESNLSNLAINHFKALAVQAHPSATNRALHPWICRALVDLFHSGVILQ